MQVKCQEQLPANVILAIIGLTLILTPVNFAKMTPGLWLANLLIAIHLETPVSAKKEIILSSHNWAIAVLLILAISRDNKHASLHLAMYGTHLTQQLLWLALTTPGLNQP